MICSNLITIRQEIAEAANKSGRSPGEIQLLAVSKRMDLSQIKEAFLCRQLLFGENFIQEAKEKIIQADPSLSWHFIGHLQSNKAKIAVQLFDMIETVDRLKTANALNRHAGELGKSLDILVQVNLGMETQKTGTSPQNTEQFIKELGTLDNLKIRGLMTMPPYSADPEKSRPYFRTLKTMSEQFRTKGYFADNSSVTLSMGMSNDFIVAIEEGATQVRVGTGIFGKRK